jgi:hypothetical protein
MKKTSHEALHEDLCERWRPSPAQIAAADDLLTSDPALRDTGVFSGHLLLNKHFGVWTTDVVVQSLDEGIYRDANECTKVVRRMAEATRRRLGVAVSGGYAWHTAPGEWAVFEDILACGAAGEDMLGQGGTK